MEKDKTIYLIDGSAYIHRAYHAVRGLSTSQGLPTNAVFGFANMLLKLLQERRPEYCVMVFDAKGPTFRHRMYEAYKANRPPMPEDLVVQLPLIKEVTRGFNVPQLEMSGYEADDVIGTLARQAEEAGFRTVLVTGDKDLAQLVTKETVIWDPMKDRTLDYGTITAAEEMEPEQLTQVMGLSGDSTDNIPGVPGIGPKTARVLVRRFGTIENLYAHIDQVAQKNQRDKLVAHKDQALLSLRLVRIDTQVPLTFDPGAFRCPSPDKKRLARLFKELEFRQLQKLFPMEADLSDKRYTAILTSEALQDLVREMQEAPVLAVDTETTSQDPMRARLVGLSFSIRENEAFYVPCGHRYAGAPQQLSVDEVTSLLGPLLENPSIDKIGQNIKYDWIVLTRHGMRLEKVRFDTMVASYLVNPSKRSHSLEQIAQDYLDHKMISFEEVAGRGSEARPFDQVPLESAVPYACEDADMTLMAYRVLEPELCRSAVRELFEQVEMPLIPVLRDMEMEGICVDRDRLYALSKSFENELIQMEQRIHAQAGEPFNIQSPQQLGRILFEKLQLPVQKKTKKKTGYSTDVDVLTCLAVRHELPALILRYRALAKLKSTYADALIGLIHPETGRVHTSFNQTVAATGRLSSSEPNLQNIPIRTEEGRRIREAFVPRPGWFLFSADYSQIELRILAHYSGDPLLMQSFRQGEDVHTRTAAEVFELDPSLITGEMRRQAKAINFGIIYGMGAYRLSQELGISQNMARTYIDHYFKRYAGVQRFIDEAIEKARATRKTTTLLGRIRILPDIDSPNRNLRESAQRTAVNTPIQGTAADLIKLAMIRVHRELSERRMASVMLLSVHDELLFESPPDELEQAQQLVKSIMESVLPLHVPLEVNLRAGKNWEQVH